MPFYEQLRDVYRLFINLEEETVKSDFLSKVGSGWKKFRLYITLPSDVMFSLLSMVKIALEVITWTEYINAERLNLVDYEYKIAFILFLLILSDSKFFVFVHLHLQLSLFGLVADEVDDIRVAGAFQKFYPRNQT